LIDGDDAGAADDGQEQVSFGVPPHGLGSGRRFGEAASGRARQDLDDDEGRAVAVDAAVVGIAGGLVNTAARALIAAIP
jgi:hypothetical protein